MDKNFRILGKISIIDILFLAVFVAGLFFLREFSAPQTVTAAPGDAKIRYTVELYRRDPDYVNNVRVGETLYDVERGFEIGKIVDAFDAPFLEDSPDFESRVYKRAEVDGLRYVYVVVEADAKITESATNIGQYQVMVGKEAFIRTKGFSAGGFIVIIEVL